MGRILIALSLVLSVFTATGSRAVGQTTPVNNPHNTYGSPLDTLKSSHLWTDVAPMQDFVKESRPDPGSLDYTPLTGADPERPKPRDPANVEALRAELEHDAVVNNRKAPAGAKRTKTASGRRPTNGPADQ